MKINEIKNGMNNIKLEARVVDIGETRKVRTRYGIRRVANALIEDETGRIKLTLWENQIDEVSVGDEIEISGAFASEFREELQLTIPRSGKIKKI